MMTFKCRFSTNKQQDVTWMMNGVLDVGKYPQFQVTSKFKKNKGVLISTMKIITPEMTVIKNNFTCLSDGEAYKFEGVEGNYAVGSYYGGLSGVFTFRRRFNSYNLSVACICKVFFHIFCFPVFFLFLSLFFLNLFSYLLLCTFVYVCDLRPSLSSSFFPLLSFFSSLSSGFCVFLFSFFSFNFSSCFFSFVFSNKVFNNFFEILNFFKPLKFFFFTFFRKHFLSSFQVFFVTLF